MNQEEKVQEALVLVEEIRDDYIDCVDKNEVLLNKWMGATEKYYEYLGKDNDWRYCIKRGFHLLWLNLKIEVISISRFLPRG